MFVAIVGMIIYGREEWEGISAKISNTKFSWGVIALLLPGNWVRNYQKKKMMMV